MSQQDEEFHGALPEAPAFNQLEPLTPDKIHAAVTLREVTVTLSIGTVLLRERPIGEVMEALEHQPKHADGTVDMAAAAVDLVAFFAVGFDTDEGRAALRALTPADFRLLGDAAAPLAFPDETEVAKLAAQFPGTATA